MKLIDHKAFTYLYANITNISTDVTDISADVISVSLMNLNFTNVQYITDMPILPIAILISIVHIRNVGYAMLFLCSKDL